MAEEKERKRGREKGKVERARGRRKTDGWGERGRAGGRGKEETR